MTYCKIFALSLSAVLLAECKSTAPTGSNPPTPSLLEVSQILDSTDSAFYDFANQTGGNAQQAIELTAGWVASLPNVQSAQALDSTSIRITLKSGLATIYYFDELDSNGLSLFRGGHPSVNSVPSLVATVPKSKNTITNKNVLIWAAAFSEFYRPNELQPIVSRMNNSGLGLTVTLMKDATCTYSTVDQFANYGLVIMDTHGQPDGFLLGTILPLTILDSSAGHLQQTLTSTIGADGYAKILTGQLGILGEKGVSTLTAEWWKSKKPILKKLWMSSKYLANIPSLSSTVVFGNMCYSGWQAPSPTTNPAIGTTFIGKNPISYYSYSFNGGTSAPVEDGFSKAMEDSLTRQFFVNLDSTGNANLSSTNMLFRDDAWARVLFKQSGPVDYSFNSCVDTFTDARDGQVYKAFCIGNQNWMAQNLNYNAPGSYPFNNDPANAAIYGRLYDWPTLMQGADSTTANPSKVQGVCPKGWHVPSNAEYVTLVSALGGSNVAGGAMKSTSPLWSSPNTGATNSSGFSGLPAGYGYDATLPPNFSALGIAAQFLTSTLTTNGNNAVIWTLSSTDPTTGEAAVAKASVNSCRCVKDP